MYLIITELYKKTKLYVQSMGDLLKDYSFPVLFAKI